MSIKVRLGASFFSRKDKKHRDYRCFRNYTLIISFCEDVDFKDEMRLPEFKGDTKNYGANKDRLNHTL